MQAYEPLIVASFLALAANRITEAFVRPIKVKFPQLDMWWLIYPTWILGGVLSWYASVNLLTGYIPDNVFMARFLTAVIVGGGANLIANTVGKKG